MLSAIKSFLSSIHVLLLCSLVLAPISCLAENLKVTVLLSNSSSPYLSFANKLRKSLPESIQASVLEFPDQLPLDTHQADLVVAVGIKATELAVTQTNRPVLAVMVPQAGYEDLLAQALPKKTAPAISAIYLNQPWDRQLDFLHAALPDRHKIGLLFSSSTHIDITHLRRKVADRNGSLVTQLVHSTGGLFAALERVLKDSDLLMAVPDSMIYSNSNIRNILLTSYHHGIPLVGLSQSYVTAGALCAIFSTPEQLAEQTSSAVISFARTKELPDSQYPVEFTIGINQQVARSLDIELPSPEMIRSQIDKAGGEKR